MSTICALSCLAYVSPRQEHLASVRLTDAPRLQLKTTMVWLDLTSMVPSSLFQLFTSFMNLLFEKRFTKHSKLLDRQSSMMRLNWERMSEETDCIPVFLLRWAVELLYNPLLRTSDPLQLTMCLYIQYVFAKAHVQHIHQLKYDYKHWDKTGRPALYIRG